MRFGRRGGAADDASLDAVENGREPEEVEREIKAEVGNGAASRPRAIGGDILVLGRNAERVRSEEHTSELQSLMRISYAVFCLKKKKNKSNKTSKVKNITCKDN